MPWTEGKPYGSFKKILLEPASLAQEAKVLAESIAELLSLWKAESLSDAETALRFVLLHLEYRAGSRAYLKTGKNLPPKEPILPFLETARFFGMPDTVRQALWKWNAGEWDIRLVDFHPTGKEMLYSQSMGYRLTTIDWEACLSGQLVEEKRDSFEHLLHDLAHAFMFFREDYDHIGQVNFFKAMYSEFSHFETFLVSDSEFKRKFEYCISDMNSHPAHLEAYWKAIRREAGIPV
ncbi:hypothetical protein [Leptospira idonii]|uniref:Uncharacterized protein n=1 Tax=Leptospira idonii TaxID=1193500 RepID=A0A4R9M119_9LEPT|nr:hypothetical protein [Leptospira idonii]TGN19742.1 hypothetical protein EHS15_08180 [Leptospira idonii]